VTAARKASRHDAVLFRTQSGHAYSREILRHDFTAARAIVFSGEERQLRDMRRSGTVEAIVGGTGPLGSAAKLANSFDRSSTLHKTYAPIELEAVRETDSAP
jgi:hypothetical protein